jgi:hypothetical protein
VNNNDEQKAIAIVKRFISDSTKQILPKANAEAIYDSNASITDIPSDKLPEYSRHP